VGDVHWVMHFFYGDVFSIGMLNHNQWSAQKDFAWGDLSPLTALLMLISYNRIISQRLPYRYG
jgi:hypothetical protein